MEVQCFKDSSGEDDFDEQEDDDHYIPWCIRHPHWTNLLLVLLYGLFGVAFFTTSQGWHPITALYVVVQVLTTIGYGDITVTTEEKVFMTCFVLLGTVLVAKVINDVSEEVLASASVRVDESLHRVEEILAADSHHVGCPALHGLVTSLVMMGFMVFLWVLFFVLYESCTCSYGFTHIEGCIREQCEATGGNTKTVVDAIYMAVITFSTVGFGDYTPDTELGRVLGCLFMVLGVVAFFNVVSAVADLISQMQRYYKNRLRLSRVGFAHIDRDGSGRINPTEFQVYMLLRQNRVTVMQLRKLDRLFECLDRDHTGRLSYEEISNGLLDVDLH